MASKKDTLKELEEVASKAGIKVRYDTPRLASGGVRFRGGMCVLYGSSLIVIDKKATDDYKIAVLAENIKKVALPDIYISPKVRELLEGY